MATPTEDSLLPLAMKEVSQPHPTSRAFYTELANGDTVHVCFTTIAKGPRTLHRPSNSDINQSIVKLANHKPLKDY